MKTALISGNGEQGIIARPTDDSGNLLLDFASPKIVRSLNRNHLDESLLELAEARRSATHLPLPNGIQLTGQLWIWLTSGGFVILQVVGRV